jgi:hypothetical protein
MNTPIRGYLLAVTMTLVGCDSAKEPMLKAREAEAAGKVSEAKTLYTEVCKASEKSPFCPVAKERIDALTAREAMTLAAEGNYAKAKEQSATISSGPAKRAYDALMKTRTVTAWATFEEANASADKAAARAKMEGLAAASSPVAEKAKEWLAKNGPALLLAEIKAACKADGVGSCIDLGKKMAKAYSSAPEAAEAQTLVDAEYKRLYPVLRQAEALLVQRLEVYNWLAKRGFCLVDADPTLQAHQAMAECNESIGIPADRGDPSNTEFLVRAWTKKLEEVHDPGWVKAFEERWAKVASDGIYDPANLPKPGEKAAGKK